jgi:hypothetical protein
VSPTDRVDDHGGRIGLDHVALGHEHAHDPAGHRRAHDRRTGALLRGLAHLGERSLLGREHLERERGSAFRGVLRHGSGLDRDGAMRRGSDLAHEHAAVAADDHVVDDAGDRRLAAVRIAVGRRAHVHRMLDAVHPYAEPADSVHSPRR